MRRVWSTLFLLVVAVALGGYIYFVEWKKPDQRDVREKAFPGLDAGTIEELTVKTAGGDTTKLERNEGRWEITEPSPMAADVQEAQAMASGLANLEISRVVEAKPADVSQYGLKPPKVQVTFQVEGEQKTQTLDIGEKTPTSGDVYARREGDPKVFLVSSFNDSVFDKTTFDLRDKAIVHVPREKVDKVELVQPKDGFSLAQQGSDWRVLTPASVRGDYAAIEGMITKLTTAQMQKLIASEVADKDLAQYGLDKPALTVTVHAGPEAVTLAVGKTGDDATFARDTSRPLVFTIENSLVTDLKKPADDYRRKDVFEFRPFNATRLEVKRGTDTFTLEHAGGPGTWQVNGKKVESSKVDDLLAKLADIRATSFVGPSANTGLKSPVLTVSVRYEQTKSETVTLARSGADAYAGRADEPGAAKIEPAALDAVVGAMNALAGAPAAPPKK